MAAAVVTVLQPVLPAWGRGRGAARVRAPLRGVLADQQEQSVPIDAWPASRLPFWVQGDTRLTLTLFEEGEAAAHARFVLEVPVGELLRHSDRVQCWCALSSSLGTDGSAGRGLEAFRAAERKAASTVCPKVFVSVCVQSAVGGGRGPPHPLSRWGGEDLDAHGGRYLTEQQLCEELSSSRLQWAQLEREAAALRAASAAASARERAEQERAAALASEALRAQRGEATERWRVTALQEEMRSGLQELQQELRARDAAWERHLAAADAHGEARAAADATSATARAAQLAHVRAEEEHHFRSGELEAKARSVEAEAAATASRGARAEEAAARLREKLRGELQARDVAWQWRALAAGLLAAAQAAGTHLAVGRLRARVLAMGSELWSQRAEGQERRRAEEESRRMRERGLCDELREEAGAAERCGRLLGELRERESSERAAQAHAAAHAAELISATSRAELEEVQEAAVVRRLQEGMEELQQHHLGRQDSLQRAMRELHGEQLAHQAEEWERCLLEETTEWASLVSEAELARRRECAQAEALRGELSLERMARLRDEQEISQLQAQLRAMEVYSSPPLSELLPPPSARLPSVDDPPMPASRHEGPVVFPHAAELELSADITMPETPVTDVSGSRKKCGRAVRQGARCGGPAGAPGILRDDPGAPPQRAGGRARPSSSPLDPGGLAASRAPAPGARQRRPAGSTPCCRHPHGS
ncbi:unnamed protein product [Prorocentrum cordatum]|uniref:Uncharacterized protein n=1 Tax=Prorocentrum cordatum TaxID=2364126 RepID=A0ABN9UNB7_9DINO|nr:unnamed protein product [Polarella glacialis]